MLVIVVGVIGGVLTQGIIGLFVGPVILAVGWELLSAWIHTEDVVPAPAQKSVEAMGGEPATRPFGGDTISG
jgi:predicted PurR-regulated permease PerM